MVKKSTDKFNSLIYEWLISKKERTDPMDGSFSFGSPCKARTYDPFTPVAMVESAARINRSSDSPGSAGYRFGKTP